MPSIQEQLAAAYAARGLTYNNRFPDDLPPGLLPSLTVIQEQEDSIVAQLQPIEEAIRVKVLSMPGKLSDLDKPFPRGAVLVHYSRSEFGPADGIGRVVQEETAIYTITIGLLNLRSHHGLYAVLRAIRLMLLGFRPRHATKAMFIKSQKFSRIAPKAKIWEYTMEFGVPTLAISRAEVSDQLLLLRLKVIDNDGDLFLEMPRDGND